MGRRSKSYVPTTRLAAALLARRGDRELEAVAPELGLHATTLSRLERGNPPSLITACAVARWLGWTVDAVVAAAEESPDVPAADPARL